LNSQEIHLLAAHDGHFADLIQGCAPQGMTVAEGGVEAPEVLTMLWDLSATIRPVFSPSAWLMMRGSVIVGLCSLVKAPTDEGVLMIGYGVAASARHQGIAGRAIAELLDWARSDPRVTAVMAETAIDNVPSRRVLEINGFTLSGDRSDAEDGDLLTWHLSL
jgi:RimJ/RimL family protein N-acetyltransferase